MGSSDRKRKKCHTKSSVYSSSSSDEGGKASQREKWLTNKKRKLKAPSPNGVSSEEITSSDESNLEEEENTEGEEEYNPDTDIFPGCSNWALIMGRKQVKEEKSVSSIPQRILSVFSTFLEKDKFQFSQSVAFLRIIRKQVNEAMNSAFSSISSSSSIRYNQQSPLEGGCKKSYDFKEKEWSTVVSFPTTSVLSKLKSSSLIGKSHNQIRSKILFYREIHSVITLYLSLVYIQRAMNNDNTNSSGYSEGMVTKMLNIIGKIPHNEMNREKYISVGRDALYLYQNVITDVSGPKHSKRLRTPQQQADFCYVIAMLVNDMPIASDVMLAGRATNLVQFASAMGDPAYRLAVHKMVCVFNSSYSVYKVLGLERKSLIYADQILSILSSRNKILSERKPRTLTQSVFLYLHPNLRDKLRASGLTSEESSLGTAVKLVSQQLKFEGIDKQSLEDGYSIINGSYDDTEGLTLKCLGLGIKDMKTVGLSTLMTVRMRKRIKRNLPFY